MRCRYLGTLTVPLSLLVADEAPIANSTPWKKETGFTNVDADLERNS